MPHSSEPTRDLDPSTISRVVTTIKVASIVFVTPLACVMTSDPHAFCAVIVFGSLVATAICLADREWWRSYAIMRFHGAVLFGVGLTWLSTLSGATEAGGLLSTGTVVITQLGTGWPWPWLNGFPEVVVSSVGLGNGVIPDPVRYYADFAAFGVPIFIAVSCVPSLRRASSTTWIHGTSLVVVLAGAAVLSWRVVCWAP